MSVHEDKRLIRELRAPVEAWPPQQPERFRRLEPEVLPPPPVGSPEDLAKDDIDFYEADRRGRRLWVWVIAAGALAATIAFVAVLSFRGPAGPPPVELVLPPAISPAVVPAPLPVPAPPADPSPPVSGPAPLTAPEPVPPPQAEAAPTAPETLPQSGSDELPPPRRVRSIPIIVPPATSP